MYEKAYYLNPNVVEEYLKKNKLKYGVTDNLDYLRLDLVYRRGTCIFTDIQMYSICLLYT